MSNHCFTDWVVPKKMRTPPTEEISAVRRGGGRDCLKNVLNLCRMSGEKEGVIANFLRVGGGYGSFLEQPITKYFSKQCIKKSCLQSVQFILLNHNTMTS